MAQEMYLGVGLEVFFQRIVWPGENFKICQHGGSAVEMLLSRDIGHRGRSRDSGETGSPRDGTWP